MNDRQKYTNLYSKFISGLVSQLLHGQLNIVK